MHIEALLGLERLAVRAFGAEHGGGNGQPRVQRGHGRIRAHAQRGTGVVEGPERIRDTGRVGPETGDDVAVIHGVLRLDAGREPQLGETRDIDGFEHLCVLDRSMCVRGGDCVERNGVRFVANGVAGNVEAMLGG